MHLTKIEHIGIAVADMTEAISRYTALFDSAPYKEEIVEDQKVKTVFFRNGPNKIELLAATDEQSVIHKFIERNGEGIHHIAFDVKDIELEMKRLAKAGFRILNEKPKRGADNKLICFIHPKDAHGTLIELCQSIPEVTCS